MKNKNQSKKLILNKETVTILNDQQQSSIKGGTGTTDIIITTKRYTETTFNPPHPPSRNL